MTTRSSLLISVGLLADKEPWPFEVVLMGQESLSPDVLGPAGSDLFILSRG